MTLTSPCASPSPGPPATSAPLTAAALERVVYDVVRISRSHGVDLRPAEGSTPPSPVSTRSSTSPTRSAATPTTRWRASDCDAQPARRRGAGRGAPPCAAVDRRDPPGRGQRPLRRQAGAGTPGRRGPVPWTIVPATQFHDFAAMVASWTERDGVATIAPLLVQPIAPADMAEILAEIAVGSRTAATPTSPVPARRISSTWPGAPSSTRPGGTARAHVVGGVRSFDGRRRAAAGPRARIAPTTFDEWLAAGATP